MTVEDVVDNIDAQLGCALNSPSPSIIQPKEAAVAQSSASQSSAAGVTQSPANQTSSQDSPTPEQAWAAFGRSQSVASVLLTLQVSQADGLNPAVSFINAYGPIAPSTMSTTSGAWSLGLQLDGTQQRQLTLSYVLDTEKLGKTYTPAYCLQRAQKTPLLNSLIKRELEGDLGLKETIEAEVIGLGLTGRFGISKSQSTVGPGGQKPTATSFSFQSQFTVVEGVNGGPNWKLMNFTGPGGGAAASAPSAVSGGSGSSMSPSNAGSAGNGSQLLNFSRSTLDQLIVTITPTCGPDGVNWAYQSTCPDQADVAAATTKRTQLASARTQQQQAVAAVNDLQNRRTLALVRHASPTVTPQAIEAAHERAEAASHTVDALTQQLEQISRFEASDKAAAAAAGSSQNLLFRLGLPGTFPP